MKSNFLLLLFLLTTLAIVSSSGCCYEDKHCRPGQYCGISGSQCGRFGFPGECMDPDE
ncbi:1309_t:CDS:2 [Funneliformis geosporum]|nr:1309_t:CDS:2 [Funneliformis geosporum]